MSHSLMRAKVLLRHNNLTVITNMNFFEYILWGLSPNVNLCCNIYVSVHCIKMAQEVENQCRVSRLHFLILLSEQ